MLGAQCEGRKSIAQCAAERLLDRYPPPVIIDEIQYAPALLRHLKIRIDEDRKRAARYLLIGSQVFALMQGVSESLAGRRTAVAQG